MGAGVDTSDCRSLMRQHALPALAVMHALCTMRHSSGRLCRSRDGESIKLIAQCKHAGGVMRVAGQDYDQAMR